MKAKEIERLLTRHVVGELPGFEVKGRLLFRAPIGDLLHFFSFDATSDKNAFSIHVAVLPLYVPADHLHFSFGRQVGGWWDVSEAETPEAVMKRVVAYLQHEGVPFLELVPDAADFADGWILLTDALPENPYVREPAAYSLLLGGRFEEAAEAVRDMYETEAADPDPHWPEVTAARAQRLERILRELDDDPQEAVDLLRMWRLESLANLKLLDFAAD